MTIAAKHFDPQLGIDIHTYLIPPSPIPIPLPTPHIGLVLDPYDYLPFIGATVHVNGVKRATAGTSGLAIHIPVGGAWMPPPKSPTGPQSDDDELFMGSKTVLADGDPFSKITMPVLACNLVGMIAPFRPRKPKKPKKSLLLPTTFNIAIPTNVFVGGPPMVSWTTLAMGAGMSILGKILKKTGIAGAAGAAFKALRQKLFANMKPGFLKCRVLRAEPVDIRDGSVSVTHEDFAIPGRLPLAWTREYRSTDMHAGQCGYGWHTPADVRLELDADGSVLFHGPDMPALFPHLPQGEGIEHAVREFVNGARLIREGHELWVRTKDGLRYGFAAGPANLTTLHARVLPIERIEDLCGNYWRFERGNGQLVRIVESGIDGLQGRFLEIDSRHGRIDRMQLHDPATGLSHPLVSYRYQDGDLTAALDALDAARSFEYRQHRMVRHTDRVCLSFHYAYDAQWRVVHAWGDGGLYDYKFRYDELLDETEVTDSLGYVSIIKFDENGLPLCEIDPLDGVTVFEYDEVGRTTAVVDPMGLRTQFAYDERGNLRELTRADGSVTRQLFDEDDRLTQLVDPGGNVWGKEYDARGLLLSQTDPLQAKVRHAYDAHGLLQVLTNARGAILRLCYDRHGLLALLRDALGHETVFTHDVLGRLLSQVDPAGQSTQYVYDAKGRLLLVSSAGQVEIQCGYDAEDQLTKCTDQAGGLSRFEYAGTGRISRRVQSDQRTVEYRYDSEERLVAVVNQRGENYQIKRDALGRIVEELDYWGQARRYCFDAASRLTEITDPLGQKIGFTTDTLGRIVLKTLPDVCHPGRQVRETFRYDKRGKLTELHGPHGAVKRSYDAVGRLVEEVQGAFIVTYRHDEAGNCVLRATSAGDKVTFEYDLRDLVARVTIGAASPIVIERDALGRATHERLSARVERSFTYDARSLLAEQRVLRDASVLFDTQYEYDSVGNLTRRMDSEQGVDSYHYDTLGRLLQHVDPKGKIRHFLNDPAGDRLHTKVQELRRQKAVGSEHESDVFWSREGDHDGTRYVFDRAGDLVRKSSLSDSATGDLELIWDANHRLIESRRGGVVTHYGYDPLGRRVFKRNSTDTTWFYWDGDALLGEVKETRDDAGTAQTGEEKVANLFDMRGLWQRQAKLHAGMREYVYYPGTFVPLALVDKSREKDRSERSGESIVRADSGGSAVAGSDGLKAPPRPGMMRLGTGADEAASRLLGLLPAHASAPLSPSPSDSAEKPRPVATSSFLGVTALGQSAVLGAAGDEGARPSPQSVSHPPAGSVQLASARDIDPRSDARPLSTDQDRLTTARLDEANHLVNPGVASDEFPKDATSVSAVQSEPAWAAVVYHYHVDPNGSPVRITDESGRVVWSANYLAWGSTIADRVPELANPLRYQGQYFDEETRLAYNRHRYFDAEVGSFVSQDPIGLRAGDNVYEMAPNGFVWFDPLGLNKISATLTTKSGEVIEMPSFRSSPGAKKIPGRVEDAEQKLLRHVEENYGSKLEGSTLDIRSEPSFIRVNGKTIPVQGINPCDDCGRAMQDFSGKHGMDINYSARGRSFSFKGCRT